MSGKQRLVQSVLVFAVWSLGAIPAKNLGAQTTSPSSLFGLSGLPDLLYSVDLQNQLIVMDPTTLVGRVIGPVTVPGVTALTFAANLDKLFGISADGRLIEIDRRSGAAVEIQKVTASGRPLFASLAYEIGDPGRLYTANTVEDRGFYRIDLAGRPPYTAVRLGSVNDQGTPAGVTGLAFQPGTSRLYAIQRNRNALGILDRATGSFEKVFGNCGINNPAGLSFDRVTGTLFGNFTSGALGTFNLQTGLATSLGITKGLATMAFAAAPQAVTTHVSRRPLPGENLLSFEQRMEAYFAPQLAAQGSTALVEEEASEYNDYRRFLQIWQPRLYPHGDFNRYFQLEKNYFDSQKLATQPAAIESNKTTLETASGKAEFPGTWREVGPNSKPAGTSSATGIGPVEFITFYAPDPRQMLCGSVAGGLFYSADSGLNWTPAGTDTQIGRTGVGTAVFHPTDSNTIFAGSSGNSGDNEAGFLGYTGGVFRTTNRGSSWTRIGSEANFGGIWTKIVKLAIHPTNPNQLWAATSAGLFVTNSALSPSPSWTEVQDLKNKYLYDFELRPGNPQWLYATAANVSAGGPVDWRIYYSSNNGTNWAVVPGLPATACAASGVVIEVSPAKVDNLYVLIQIPDLAIAGQSTIHRSELHIYDFGINTWNPVYGSAHIPWAVAIPSASTRLIRMKSSCPNILKADATTGPRKAGSLSNSIAPTPQGVLTTPI